MPDVVRHDWQPAIRPLEEGRFVAAIGDVHGHAALLARMHEAIDAELQHLGPSSATVIHLGDIIDNGPSNHEALLVARKGVNSAETITLRGNHEDRMIRYLTRTSKATLNAWLNAGGWGMFEQMGIDPFRTTVADFIMALGEDLVDWLLRTPVIHRIGSLAFVHAGIDPARAIDDQDPHILMWTRKAWIDSPGPYLGNVAVIHGHIPRRFVDLSDPHRIDLDSGIVNSGTLSALVIYEDRMRLLQVS